MLLHSRMMTLKKHGIEAMSLHDIRNGYKPRDIIRLILGQILAHYPTLESELKAVSYTHLTLPTTHPLYISLLATP